MLEEDLDLPSPNSLASYQSGLLEAMLVEQGGLEGSSSPMEVSTQEVDSKEQEKEEIVKPTKEKQDDTWLNVGKFDISEDTRSDDELTIICNDCDLEEVAQIEMDENLVCEIEQNQESLEVSLEESACFVPDSMSDTDAIANFAEAEMYKLDVVPLSELLQAATYPTNELELGELAGLKSKLKQAINYESDTPKDDAAWM
ncbi:hypothetical protein RHGRI_030741 [Rhododendron griersonianum]|uniref:Uncharacterized protein n=1 Tax=Rhododendron griersonianum TaxID=479676 RepID=A0AAV6I5J0_9ERIC|nr:hypothetical protein RHGRI_030741 [Rhododendron griersonianum]